MSDDSEICKLAYEGRFDELRSKIEKDKDFIHRKDRAGRAVLHWACSGGHKHIVDLLLEQGAAVDDPDDSEWTPLMIASSVGRHDIVAALISRGADVNRVNASGQTPLHYAASKNRVEVARMLIENHGRINVGDNMGSTPLHRAASKGNSNIVKMLINDYGDRVDLNCKDSVGNTPLHLACEEYRMDVAELLVEAGASVEVLNKHMLTPLDVAPPNIRRFLQRITLDEP